MGVLIATEDGKKSGQIDEKFRNSIFNIFSGLKIPVFSSSTSRGYLIPESDSTTKITIEKSPADHLILSSF